jgi:hypothetical protein
MNSFYFDYDTFYNYYTEDSHLIPDYSNPREIWHYKKEKYTNQPPEKNTLSDKYIKVGNTKIYISKTGTDGLYFTIPEQIGDKLWDNHFHFGKVRIKPPDKQYQSNTKDKKIPVVYFHKTTQHPDLPGKDRKKCYYHPTMQIDNLGEIICLQEMNRKMGEKFLPTTEDFHLIKEIISRPFPPESNNKKKSYSNVLTSNKSNKYHSSTHKNTKHSGNSPRGGTKKKKIRKYGRKSLRRR